jgi:hypothetical protein
MRKFLLAGSTALVALAATAAFAADAPKPGLVRGTVASFDGKTLSMTTKDGTVSAPVAPTLRIFTVAPLKFSDLNSTDFVGVTAVPGQNGHLTAEEIHVLPAHVGEGQYPWDHHVGEDSGRKSAGSMTNGMVAPTPKRAGSMTNGMVAAGANNTLTVTYTGSDTSSGKCEGHAPMAAAAPTTGTVAPPAPAGCAGTAIIDVPAGTPIVTLVPGTAADVKPGLQAVAGAGSATPGGPVGFGSITLEKNGVKPEF